MIRDADGDPSTDELELLRRRSAEREQRLWELEEQIPAAVSRVALVRSTIGGWRELAPRRRTS